MLYQLSHYRIAFVMQKYDLSATSPKIEANFTFFNSIFVASNRKRVYLCSANGTQIIILYEETRKSNNINHKKTLKMKKKFICTVCGYIYEGEEAPAKCPQCGVPASKFKMVEEDAPRVYVTEHVVGVAKGCPEEIMSALQSDFKGECTEVGMYLAMARQADREGYPEIAEAFKRYAFEEADHASRFAELIGDLVWDTKTNLEKRAEAECGACAGKMKTAKAAKEAGLDAIHDTVHEMAKDEARHGRGFEGLLKRYFGK